MTNNETTKQTTLNANGVEWQRMRLTTRKPNASDLNGQVWWSVELMITGNPVTPEITKNVWLEQESGLGTPEQATAIYNKCLDSMIEWMNRDGKNYIDADWHPAPCEVSTGDEAMSDEQYNEMSTAADEHAADIDQD
tara:strand:- start:175 stop:585 length:411 start_codon:yes stop_codon:yes gene_type:complete